MGDPTTIALNLTFFGTLAVAFAMFLGLFAVFVTTLLIAGIGRLAAAVVMALAAGLGKDAGVSAARRPDKLPLTAKAALKEAPQLAPEWAAAVARADERAAARAKAEALPAVKVSVRDLPSPTAPVQDIGKVAPLVESATDRNGGPGAVARSFKKPPAAAKSLLDTGSLASHGRLPLRPDKRPAQERKAG